MSKQEEEVEEIKDEKKKKKERSVIQTKVVIRRLPVGMNKVQFMEVFDPLPPHDYLRFVPGDRSLAPYNYARSYINFLNTEDIVSFRDKYDGIELELKTGRKSVCVVEYAPFQKVLKKGRKKDDPKADTIFKDADYIKFLETLEEAGEKETIDLEKYLEELELRDKLNQKSVETPLTTFVKQRRDERRRVREERRKQDIERRKRKDEERRKKREAERKRRFDLEKSKRKDVKVKDEADGKKTLGETKREMQENSRARKTSESNGDDVNKMKILQKSEGDGVAKKSQEFKKGVFSANELEESWTGDYSFEWPGLNQNDESSEKPHNRYKEGRYRPSSSRDYPSRRWKDGYSDSRPLSAKAKDSGADVDGKKDEDNKFKSKKPDREIYQPGPPRGRGGFRGGRGSRPQKYSEQRSRSAKKSESEK